MHHAINVNTSGTDASFEIEEYLISKGVDINALDYKNRTPLFYALIKMGKLFETSEIDPFETISNLCAIPGIHTNTIDKFGKNLLHYAA